jgi:hypothetical protein
LSAAKSIDNCAAIAAMNFAYAQPILQTCFSATAALFDSKLNQERRAAVMTTFFRHYRQRGPISALQMRLQG